MAKKRTRNLQRKKLLTEQMDWQSKNRIPFWERARELFKILRIRDYFMIPRMDLVLTARCTLRCADCANLMQYYEKPKDVPYELIAGSTATLLNAVDYIREIMVLGGEPFLYDKLKEVLSLLTASNKVGKIIVVTNATICPEDRSLIEQLKDPKICVRISDYRQLSRKMKELILLFEKEKIHYIREKQNYWFDTGNMEKRGRSKKELTEVFRNCSTLCRSFYQGEFFYCPRQAHGTDLGLIPREMRGAEESIKVQNYASREELKEALRRFCGRKKAIAACDYCDVRTKGYAERHILPARQLKGDFRDVGKK